MKKLIEKHYSEIYKQTCILTRDRELASDLLHDACIRALSNQDKFEMGTNFPGWLFTIVRNRYYSHLLKQQRDWELFEQISEYLHNFEGTKPFGSAYDDLAIQDIKGCIKSLPPKYEIIFQDYIDGFKYEEIAQKMEIPVGTVKSYIHNARNKVINKLQSLGYTEGTNPCKV